MLYKKITYKQIWKNEKDNKYANISSYIAQNIWWNIQFILQIAGQKWSHPCGDDDTQIRKKTIYNNRHQRFEEIWLCVHILP